MMINKIKKIIMIIKTNRCVVRRMVQALPHRLKMVGGTPRVPRRRNTKDQGEQNNQATLKQKFEMTKRTREIITYLFAIIISNELGCI